MQRFRHASSNCRKPRHRFCAVGTLGGRKSTRRFEDREAVRGKNRLIAPLQGLWDSAAHLDPRPSARALLFSPLQGLMGYQVLQTLRRELGSAFCVPQPYCAALRQAYNPLLMDGCAESRLTRKHDEGIPEDVPQSISRMRKNSLRCFGSRVEGAMTCPSVEVSFRTILRAVRFPMC